MQNFNVVGHSVLRKDVEVKATGKACYTGDMKFEGMLYGKALRSAYPHAKIISMLLC